MQLARERQRREKIERDDLRDRSVVVTGERLADVATRVVDEHVQLRGRRLHDPRAIVGDRDVRGDAGDPTAVRCERLGDPGLIACDDHDAGAEGDELINDGAADALASAGDER